jgi:small subunit ribosomal protein S6
MAKTAAYDLFVLLDLESPDERRAAIVEQIRGQLQSRADLKGDLDWGSRRLAYEIDHRTEAQYHLFQFESAPDVLPELDRSLAIEDAVIRHRIIRLPGEAPAAPPRPSPDEPRRTEERGDRNRGRGPRGAPEDQASEAPPAAEQETAPAETAGETAPAEPVSAAAEPADVPDEPASTEEPASVPEEPASAEPDPQG